MSIELASYGIKNSKINYQLSPQELTEKMVELGQGEITSSGAVNMLTGEFTGRSPKDRFIVKDDIEYGYKNILPLWAFGLTY